MKTKIRILVLVIVASVGIQAAQEERTITGKITSQEDGSVLPGVNVVLKGTSRGTVTDNKGDYRGVLKNQFSFIISPYLPRASRGRQGETT